MIIKDVLKILFKKYDIDKLNLGQCGGCGRKITSSTVKTCLTCDAIVKKAIRWERILEIEELNNK